MGKRIIGSAILMLATIYVFAQETQNVPVKNAFQGTVFINEQSANLVNNGELILQIQHRFGDISYGIDQFFGLDLAVMRLGFVYGLAKNINVGIGRSNMLKTYDASAKFRLMQQTDNMPITMTATIEGSIPTIRNYFPASENSFSNKVSGTAQLQIAKTMGIVGLQISPGYLHTGYLYNEQSNYDLFTLGLAGSLKLSKHVSFNLEYLNPFEDKLQSNKPLSVGVDISTGGHIFQLMLTNSQGMINQALYTNTYGDWGKGHIYFGFNLIRKFKIRYTDEDYF